MIRTLLVAFSLVGGLFATNETAQETVSNTFNNARNGIEERQAQRQGKRAMTSEEQELRDLLKDLLEEADFQNLTAEEKVAAMEGIIEELTAKADTLGVDITPFIEKFEERVEQYELHNTEEWILFRKYMDELKAEYDFDNLTPEERISIMDEVHDLMLAKAEELGIDITEIIDRQLERKENYEYMYSPEMVEFKVYLEEVKASYDFESMTNDEKLVALEEIHALVEAKAEELGIDLDALKGPNMNPGQKGRVEGFRKGFKAGRNYERSQQPEETVTSTGETA